jgi:transcriptional regulator with XRE-family HTH domain
VQGREQLGANIRRARHAAGLSQMALADRCGVHFTEISRLELADRDPRLTTILKVARGLDVTPSELLEDVR